MSRWDSRRKYPDTLVTPDKTSEDSGNSAGSTSTPGSLKRKRSKSVCFAEKLNHYSDDSEWRNMGWNFTFESVYETMEDFEIGEPVMDSLRLGDQDQMSGAKLSEEWAEDIQRVLIANISWVNLNYAIPVDLNTLLMTNSPIIFCYGASLSDKDVNRNLKLWINGSNP